MKKTLEEMTLEEMLDSGEFERIVRDLWENDKPCFRAIEAYFKARANGVEHDAAVIEAAKALRKATCRV